MALFSVSLDEQNGFVLEDKDLGFDAVFPSSLIGKVLAPKTLNKNVVPSIITGAWKSFLRIRVEVNTQNPLPWGLWLQRTSKELRTRAAEVLGPNFDNQRSSRMKGHTENKPPLNHRGNSPFLAPNIMAACKHGTRHQPQDNVQNQCSLAIGGESCIRFIVASETGGSTTLQTILSQPQMGNIEVGHLFLLIVQQSPPNLIANPVVSSDAIVQKSFRLTYSTGLPSEPPSPSTGSNYFITEPPDSPRNDNTIPPSLGIALNPGPFSPLFGPSNTLDLCLSKAINTLSLKCKGSDESPPPMRPTKLLKGVTSH
ncbi:hypothetical protein ACSBR2_019865 [Camellia fascicularis]